MNVKQTINKIQDGSFDTLFAKMYDTKETEIELQKARYMNLANAFLKNFSEKEVKIFSSAGRTEIGGNHTDHNLGKVLAGSINLDCIAIASANGSDKINICDITYNEYFTIDLNAIDNVHEEHGSISLVKGVIDGLRKNNAVVQGFDVAITSNIISAAGVSSSAAFEMLFCTIINAFFNDNKISKVTYAKVGQYAENVYADKQSGLLDQMACAYGGMIAIDFNNPDAPLVKEIDFDFASANYNLLIVKTGSNHADLSKEYTSIPTEMKSVAKTLGKNVLREVTEEKVIEHLPKIRAALGDRAALRALHFFEENARVEAEVAALEKGDFDSFLQLITASGNSSWKWLQNCYVPGREAEQNISIALALSEIFIKRHKKGACRIHGGGFAGVIAVYLPEDLTDAYIEFMNGSLGKDMVYKMKIRPYGAVCVNDLI